MSENKLIVVGTGIRTSGQMTMESISWIQKADKVFYVVGDPIAEEMIKSLNSDTTSMRGLYGEGKSRIETYEQMIDVLLDSVRNNKLTVGAFYGHPGVFAYPPHESIKRAKAEGFEARMLPGISAEDCLFADLNVDPAANGCQSYEATDFLLNGRIIDNSSQVILWQIGVIGDWTYKSNGYDISAMPLLLEKLYKYYPPTHVVTIYEAATIIGCEPVIKNVPLHSLPHAGVTAASTLYIPPSRASSSDPNYYYRMKISQK